MADCISLCILSGPTPDRRHHSLVIHAANCSTKCHGGQHLQAMLLMQLKGKRHPVSVYEVVPLALAGQLPAGQQLLAGAPMEGAHGSHGLARGPMSLHGPPVDLQTPLIGAAATMSKVGRAHHAHRCQLLQRLSPQVLDNLNRMQMSEWVTDVKVRARLADLPIQACGRQGLPSA